MKKVLITGCAGFVGSSLTDDLLSANYQIVGIDNFNDYYDPKIKVANLNNALQNRNFKLFKKDILNFDDLREIFRREKPEIIVHLAARAGVRPSIHNPKLYVEVNVQGTVNLLKLSADYKVKKFIFGSSSSVYGNHKRLPFHEDDPCDSIISPYGTSKRSAEFFIESFHKSRGLNCVILRFFTVYGPRGRLDMVPALFTKAIMDGAAINQYGDGSSSRDYTYVDDIVRGAISAMEKEISFETINLGNNNPIILKEFIRIIEKISGKKAIINKMPLQDGDVLKTWANISKAKKLLGWQPEVSTRKGILFYHKWLLKNKKA